MNPRLALLFLAQALAVGATTGSQVLSSIIASQLGREALAGLPSTLYTLAAALSAYPFGRLMARAGRRPGLVGAYLLAVVGALVGFLGARAGSFPLFLVGSMLMGAALGGYQQGRYAAAESVPAHRRAAAMSLLLFGSVLGSVLSAAVAPQVERQAREAGMSSEVLGWLIAGGFLLISAALTFFWRDTTSGVSLEPARPVTGMKPWRDPIVRAAALALGASQGVMVTLMVLTPLRAHHLGHGHAGVQGLLTLHFLGMFGFAWAVGPLVDRLGARVGLVMASMLLVSAALLLPSDGTFALGASLFLLGLGWNFGYVSGSSLLAARRDAQGTGDAVAFLSAGLGALGGSLVATHLGFGVLAALGAAAGLLPLVAALQVRANVAERPAGVLSD